MIRISSAVPEANQQHWHPEMADQVDHFGQAPRLSIIPGEKRPPMGESNT